LCQPASVTFSNCRRVKICKTGEQCQWQELLTHLNRVAEFSRIAMPVVWNLRHDSTASPSPDVIAADQTAYAKTIFDLVSEEGTVAAICQRR